MGYILSCGHREDDESKHHSITTKKWEFGESGRQKALSYKTVCETCYKDYQEEGLIFYSEEEALEWLTNPNKD